MHNIKNRLSRIVIGSFYNIEKVFRVASRKVILDQLHIHTELIRQMLSNFNDFLNKVFNGIKIHASRYCLELSRFIS
jgi:hypothetical protein